MATVKVSALTELTTTDGAEELLVNDGGTSKKVTIANLLHDESIDSDHYVDGSIDLAHMSSESVDEDIDNLMEMLDGMVDTDVQEPASELSTEDKPKEHKGAEPSSKAHEKGEKVETIGPKDHMGGLFQIKTDLRSKTRSKSLPTPSGSQIKRKSNIPHPETLRPLVEKFRDELRSLADRQRVGVQQFRERL